MDYRYRLYTHCGLDFFLDFDSSFWQVVRGSISGWFRDPETRGELTLRADGLLVFRWEEGRALFVRHPWPKPALVCD